MGYRFTRGWSHASVAVGTGLFVLALLVASWLGFSNDEEFKQFAPGVRILAALMVSFVGLILGGTMIVAGQLVSVLLEQRDLLERIHQVLAARAGAGSEAVPRS
jgi:heme A synthase